MAKKGTGKLKAGTRIRVKDGVTAPEFPEILVEGWTGTIVEASKKKSVLNYIIEWDDDTVGRMPPEYLQRCEENQLYHLMACLGEGDVESADAD